MAKVIEDLEALRCAPSDRIPIADLVEQQCVCCGSRQLAVCRYPAFRSRFFAGRLLISCGECGLSWVPVPGLDLEGYYRHQYAQEFRAERAWPGRFYASENPVWSREKHPVRDRAARQHELVRAGEPYEAVLDIGAGEGFLLHALNAKRKYADEWDENSVRILRDELGVEVAPVEAFRGELDLVVASHVLEHFTYETIRAKLVAILEALRPGGTLLAEVPPGAGQISNFCQGKRPRSQQLEPHTLFFSSYSLACMLRNVGFSLVKAKVCGWSAVNIPYQKRAEVYAGIEAPELVGPVVLARRPEDGRRDE